MSILINNTILNQNLNFLLLNDKNLINKEVNKKPPIELKNILYENELERDKTVNEIEKKGKIINTKA
jgi:hypothetical protein